MHGTSGTFLFCKKRKKSDVGANIKYRLGAHQIDAITQVYPLLKNLPIKKVSLIWVYAEYAAAIW